jgi:hypothetical protein
MRLYNNAVWTAADECRSDVPYAAFRLRLSLSDRDGEEKRHRFIILNIDNKAHVRYLNKNWFCLIDASICCASAEVGTHSTVFSLSALKKQPFNCLERSQH